MRALRILLVLVLAASSAGCTLPWGNDGAAPPTPATPNVAPDWPPLIWGGVVVDALGGEPIADARVRIDLSQVLPCSRQGLGWSSWHPDVDAGGTFGPLETPRPRSNDVAFFAHVSAPGYSTSVLHVGPAQAREGLDALRFVLHPRVNVTGTAPPGTVLALEGERHARLAVADERGHFAFEDARTAEIAFVAATDWPHSERFVPPQTVSIERDERAGWRLEGALRLESGAGVPADVVAWNGTHLVSAARASDTGHFSLPLRAEPAKLRIEARTSDGQWGAALALEVNGPPATRETLLMRALC